jgi:N-methylhydantoinase A
MTEIIAPWRIGVDVGGTFTDLVLVDSGGSVQAFKSPSNPADPEAGVLAAVDLAALQLGLDRRDLLAGCSLFVHGSTIATNTLLERKGARSGMITTAGFRDSLEIRRGMRVDPWDHRADFPEVLVPRSRRHTVTERLGAAGAVLTPLDEESVRRAGTALAAQQVEAVAICLLHAYRNPAHERRVAEILAPMLPGVWISCSSDVAPVIGEYERGSTSVVNAFVAPRVVPYLRALEKRLAADGLPDPLLLVQSNGGAIAVAEVTPRPVQLVLSGPAAGVGAIRYFGRDAGSENLIAIEVGGTSCDVTLSHRGAIGMTDQLEVDGHHLAMPAVEIHTVGAGGGTIARIDGAGLMQAGPQGAGARPGPACYGFGGERPTVTDCQLILGRLRPGPYAGGAISLDLERAVTAVQTHLAAPLGITVEAAAVGVLRLVEQTIQHAVERVSIERGYNPRDFTLIACGGAGPLHGPATARALGCRAVYVPRLAGVFCAFGMCNTDLRQDHMRGWLSALECVGDPDLSRMRAAMAELRASAEASLSRQGFATADQAFVPALDMRYAGQQWPITVPCTELSADAIRTAFEAAYRQLFGYLQEGGLIEVVNLRLAGIGRLPEVALRAAPATGGTPEPMEIRMVWIDSRQGRQPTPVYEGLALRPGQSIAGPAVIDEATTTLLVGAGETLRVTGADNYLIELGEGSHGRL